MASFPSVLLVLAAAGLFLTGRKAQGNRARLFYLLSGVAAGASLATSNGWLTCGLVVVSFALFLAIYVVNSIRT